MGPRLCPAGLFLVRGGLSDCRYCCLRFSDWIAGSFKKIRSDVMSSGKLSSTASLSEKAGSTGASAATHAKPETREEDQALTESEEGGVF